MCEQQEGWICHVCKSEFASELVDSIVVVERGRATWCCGAACTLQMVQSIEGELEQPTVDLTTKVHPDLGLSVRSRKALQLLDITTLGDLVGVTECELAALKNFGPTSLNEIKAALASRGLSLRKVR